MDGGEETFLDDEIEWIGYHWFCDAVETGFSSSPLWKTYTLFNVKTNQLKRSK